MKKINLIVLFIVICMAFTMVSCSNQSGSGQNEQPAATKTPLPTPLPTAKATATPNYYADQNTSVPEKKEYSIKKATGTITIDGEKEESWNDALKISLDNKNTWNPLQSNAQCQGGTIEFLWSEEGLYVYAEITDANKYASQPAGGSGTYNSGDGLQLAIYADSSLTTSAVDKMFFFSLCPQASDGNAYIGEHFCYGDGNTGGNVAESEIAVKNTDNGYIIEALIKADVFKKSTPQIKFEEGTSFPMLLDIMDINEYGTQALFADSPWFNAPNTNKYTLVK